MSMTLFQLVKSTETFRARQYKSGKVLNVKVKYVHWNKQLYIQGEVKSGTERNKTYKVQIVFNGIQSSPKRTRQHTLKYIDIEGSTIWIERADPKKHNVLTRCSNCPDFRFVGHWYIADKKALLGPRIPYQKVPGSNRPSVNPDRIPTLCKHQLELLKRLMSGRVRLVKRDPYIVSYLNRPKRVSK